MKTKAQLVIIITIALIPRLLSLSAFLTQDEFLWLDRSRNFLLALQGHDWAETFQTGHPAVTTMWTGSLGLWAYGKSKGMSDRAFETFLKAIAWDKQPLELWPYLRLPTGIVTSLGIGGIFYLLKRLFKQRIAFVAALLLALDPWYLAHSRILYHDALVTTFMTLSALALLLYIWRGAVRWALFLSGVCAGLALLSKSLALFLLPWTVLLFMLASWRRRWPLSQVHTDGALWGLTAWLTFFVLWPAMWLNPSNTLWRMRQMATTYTINPHAQGQFFLGQAVADPGGLFYPVVALFAMTPLVMLGLVGIAVKLRKLLYGRDLLSLLPLLLLLLYIAAYLTFVSLGEKKRANYLLPAVVMLNVVAAVGIASLIEQLPPLVRQKLYLPAVHISIIFITQGLINLYHHPYYFTYYNPLLGGKQVAAQNLLIGWGEGNELAADYLNHLPNNAEHLKVVASKPSTFAPYFEGETLFWYPQAKVLAADYLVLYRRDVQQGEPEQHWLRYIRQNWPLEETITLHNLPYAWIYRAPAADWTLSIEDQRIFGHTGLLGYRVRVLADRSLQITLYRRYEASFVGQWIVQVQRTKKEAIAQATQSSMLPSEPDTIIEQLYLVDSDVTRPSHPYQIKIGFRREANDTPEWFPLVPQVK